MRVQCYSFKDVLLCLEIWRQWRRCEWPLLLHTRQALGEGSQTKYFLKSGPAFPVLREVRSLWCSSARSLSTSNLTYTRGQGEVLAKVWTTLLFLFFHATHYRDYMLSVRKGVRIHCQHVRMQNKIVINRMLSEFFCARYHMHHWTFTALFSKLPSTRKREISVWVETSQTDR